MGFVDKAFVGRSIEREPEFEAHLFMLAQADDREAVRQAARVRGFRLSARPKVTHDGLLDLLVTKNKDDGEVLEGELRTLADNLIQSGFEVYRIRLEKKVFDEVDRTYRGSVSSHDDE